MPTNIITKKVFSQSSMLRRLIEIEQDFQKLKLEFLSNLPQKEVNQIYPQAEINKTVRNIRQSIWQKRYAQKVKDIS